MKHKDFFRHSTKSTSTTPDVFIPSMGKPHPIAYGLIIGFPTDDLYRQIKKANRFSDFWEQHKRNIAGHSLSQYLREMLEDVHTELERYGLAPLASWIK